MTTSPPRLDRARRRWLSLGLAASAGLLARPSTTRAADAVTAAGPATSGAAAALPEPPLRFATGAEAAAVLGGGSDPAWWASLGEADLRLRLPSRTARKDVAGGRDALRRHYAAQAAAFDADERAVLQAVVRALHPVLAERAPRFARTPWSFLKCASTVEGGMPHTRGPWIVLSDDVLADLVRRHAARPAASASAPRLPLPGAALLVHEQAHVLQRADPARFEPLYTAVWGFRRIPPPAASPWYARHGVSNPDGPLLEWAFPLRDGDATRWILPAVAAPRDDATDFSTMLPVALPLEERDGAWAMRDDDPRRPRRPLSSESAYVARFPWSQENFHPNEIAAELLAAWLAGPPGFEDTSPQAAASIAWARVHLG